MLQVTLPTERCSKHAVEENDMDTPNYEPNSTCPVHSHSHYTNCLPGAQSHIHSHFLGSTRWK